MSLSNQCIFNILITVIIVSSVHSQSDIYSKNQFEFTIYSGGSLVQFDHESGLNKMKNQITPIFGTRLQYNRKLTEKFKLNGAVGIGTHGFTYALPEVANPNISSERNNYFNLFQEAYVGVGYEQLLKNKLLFGVNLGGGVVNFFGEEVGISSVYQNSESEEGPQTLSSIFYIINPRLVPFLQVGPQITRKLKNKNQVSLKLSYIQSLRPIYEGHYQVFDNISNGKLSNSGSNFRISLSYIFTGDQRQNKISKLNTELDDRKAAKLEYKKQKRFIHPKSIFVSLISGVGAVKSYAEDPNRFLEDSYGQSIATRLMVEKGIDNNIFAEAGYQLLEYYGSLKFKSPSGGSILNDFFTHQLNVGAGYRVIGKKRNYHYFNIHGGLSVGFISQSKGTIIGEGGGSTSFGTTTDYYQMSYSYKTEIVSSVIIAPYIGMSKDFRLSERMFITLMYRYQYGLNKLSQRSITYQDNEQYTTPQNASNYTNGTEQTVQLGLKFKLGGK